MDEEVVELEVKDAGEVAALETSDRRERESASSSSAPSQSCFLTRRRWTAALRVTGVYLGEGRMKEGQNRNGGVWFRGTRL